MDKKLIHQERFNRFLEDYQDKLNNIIVPIVNPTNDFWNEKTMGKPYEYYARKIFELINDYQEDKTDY